MIPFKTAKIIDVGDWDQLVIDTYGKPYNLQQQDGCRDRGLWSITVPIKNAYDYPTDSIPEEINGDKMGVSFSAWLARDPKEWNGATGKEAYLHIFWERNFYPYIDMLINDLYAKGLIDAGEYSIDIDW